MTRLPHAAIFPPRFTALPYTADLSLAPETPYGLAYGQVLRESNMRVLAARLASELGADARATVHIEAYLRWRTGGRRADREPLVLSHDALASIDYGDVRESGLPTLDRALVGDGLLLVVACQIVPSTEAWRAYSELLGGEPIGAFQSTLLASDDAPPLSDRELATLTPLERQRLELMRRKLGRGADKLFAECGKRYHTTLDMLAADAVDQPPEAPVQPAAADEDDLPMAVVAARRAARAVAQPPVVVAAPPPPSLRAEALEIWQRSVLANRQFGVNLIVRGYVARASVRAARRLLSPLGVAYYVLPSSAVYSDADAALASVQRSMPRQLEEAAQELPVAEPVAAPIWRRHLLDRLARLDLGRLTYYEVDRATRDRLSVHLMLYSHVVTNTEVESRAYVLVYPRSYRAPVLQRYVQAPGLSATAGAYDYAAIGLAGLCIAATAHPPLAQWLLESEAYLHRVRLPGVDPTAYIERIEQQIHASQPPRKGSALARLVANVVADAVGGIADSDKHRIAIDSDDEQPSDEVSDVLEESGSEEPLPIDDMVE
jgi:hypothetical protein